MPIDIKETRRSFERLTHQFAKLRKKTTPDAVHKVRTGGRRVEALLSEIVTQPNRNEKKLLQLLAEIRRKAGKVRDLDVQIAALRALKIDGGNGEKTQLIETLAGKRVKSEKKLARACNRKMEKDIRRLSLQAMNRLDQVKDAVPLALALNRLAELGRSHFPLTEKGLHQYRIVGKRARYIAELDPSDRQARQLVKQLKSVQDVIGDWHDWLKMTQRAERLLGGARESVLVATLQNLTRAKYRAALDAVSEIRTGFAKPVSVAVAPTRTAGSPQSSRAASAA
jgi:CHAD domain-containing protein